jgi:hypothetical protein
MRALISSRIRIMVWPVQCPVTTVPAPPPSLAREGMSVCLFFQQLLYAPREDAEPFSNRAVLAGAQSGELQQDGSGDPGTAQPCKRAAIP